MTPLHALVPEAGAGPRLDPKRIVETVATLRERIRERFPSSGLERVAGDLHGIAEATVDRLAWTDRPHVPLRAAVVLVILLIVGIVASVTFRLNFQARVDDLPTLLQAIESGLNDVLLLGAAILFLVTAERRVSGTAPSASSTSCARSRILSTCTSSRRTPTGWCTTAPTPPHRRGAR